MIRKVLVLSAVLILACRLPCVWADDYILSKIDYQAGLSHSAVISIFQDRSGLMWFGTYDGVNCYDGKTMEVYRSDFSTNNTLSNNVIHSILQAPGDYLWFDTHLGLDLFSKDSLKVRRVYHFNGDYSVVSNSNGDTWAATADTLWYFNTVFNEFFPVDINFNCNDIQDKRLFVEDTGDLWYFPENSGKAMIYSVSSFRSDVRSVKGSVFKYNFHSLPVRQMFYQNGIVCFTDALFNLYLYDIQKKTKQFVRNVRQMVSIYGDISEAIPFYDNIVIGFRTSGLVKISTSDNDAIEEMDRNMRIYGLYKDTRQGILWAATDGDGAVYFAKKKSVATNIIFRMLSPNLSRQVRSVFSDRRGNLWIGTKGDGIVRIPAYQSARDGTSGIYGKGAEVYFPDFKYDAVSYSRNSTEFQVYSMSKSNAGNGFWVGSGATGLFWYSERTDRLVPVTDNSGVSVSEIHSIYEESDSVLYIASAIEGFHRLVIERHDGEVAIKKDKRYTFYDKGADISLFYPMIPDGDSLLWLGSRGRGLIRFDRKTEEYYVISLSSILGKPVDDILSLCRSRSGDSLYIGTTSGLVSFCLKTKAPACSYTGRGQGLLNDMVHGILEGEDGFLWLSTNRGLVKYNPFNGESLTYYYSAGVEIGEFSDDAYYVSPYTGEMFFGGIDGLLWINADVGKSPGFYADIMLRSIEIGKDKFTVAEVTAERNREKAIVLKGKKASFALTFVAVDYLAGGEIEYSYKLEGYDFGWSVFMGSNRALYTLVPSGDYVFNVRYKKDVFDTEYRSFSMPLSIVPPWYASRTAFIIYFILGFASVLSVFFLVYIRAVRLKAVISSYYGREGDCQDMSGFLSSIYSNLWQLRSESISYGVRCLAVDRIRETVLRYGSSEAVLSSVRESMPERYSISCEVDVLEFIRETVAYADKESPDTGLVEISGHAQFTVYTNAFRSIFYFCFLYLKKKRAASGISISCPDDRKYLRVSVSSDDSALSDLYHILSGKAPETVQNRYGGGFKEMFYETAAINAVKRLDVRLSYDEKKAVVDFVFSPAENAFENVNKRDSVLLLSDSVDLACCVSESLSKMFAVKVVRDAEEAFRKLSDTYYSVFVADLRIFQGREKDFVRMMHEYRFAVSGTRFVPLLSWSLQRAVSVEMVRICDSFCMLPYDIPFLQDIVTRVIYGKHSIIPVYIEELNSLDINLTCESDKDTVFVRKVLNIIDVFLDSDNLGTTLISEQMAMSQSQFFRKFKKIFNTSPETLIKNYRIEKASRLFLSTNLSVGEAMTAVGISSRSYFSKEFTARFGCSPKEYMSILRENREPDVS